MSPDILLKIKQSVTQNSGMNKKRIDLFLSLISHYKKDDIIYPGTLIRKLNINMKKAYELLELLEQQDILERNFEIYCSGCNKYTGAVYRTIKDIPDNLTCEGDCYEKIINPLEDTIIVYRIVTENE